MACGSSSRGIESLMVEFQAGDIMAVQLPATKTRKSRVAGPATPPSSSAASTPPATACSVSATVISLARSVMSASTPAGSDSKNMGMNTAVCTKAARNDDPVSSTIIHAADIDCMALPMK